MKSFTTKIASTIQSQEMKNFNFNKTSTTSTLSLVTNLPLLLYFTYYNQNIKIKEA